MKKIIASYEESCRLVKNRVDELSHMMKDTTDLDTLENLKTRRNILNSQLYHMREIIQILEGYQKRIDLIEKETH
ncbi:MAG: hypothetical protein ACI4WH_04190 [Oscillospiraceae bacterium]